MRLRRGCGCPLVLLVVFNTLMVVGSFLAGGDKIKWPMAIAIAALFVGNAIVAALMALAAIRRSTISSPPAVTAEEEEEGMGLQSTESEPDEGND